MSATEQGLNSRVTEPEPEDAHVLELMSGCGGSFARALADAGYRADSVNLAKIKATWPELWAEYAAMARARLRKVETAERGPS